MIGYDNEFKEKVRSENDIVDVVSQYLPLKRSGRNYFGICPFHSEKSPSFSVSPDRQYFHCFGCHAGGDVFSFISKIENLSFKEAIEFLAERAKIPLPELERKNDPKQYLKDRMYQINAETALFYHERLYKPLAKIAQDYVKKRKLDNKTLKAFKIGYSGEYNELYKMLKAKGFKDDEILATGLVNKNDKGQFIDRFRKRLMFPIMNVQGKVVAFGGRRLQEDLKVAKYINSNENLVYSKKQHLFALNLAKLGDCKKMILVEGYMDVVSLHQRGITNVVASLGTALTEEQGRLLRKYSEQVVLSYDSDGAGQTAILRGLEVLKKLGCDGRVLQMEGAKDPDEFIIKYGSGRFNILVENAISLTEFKAKMLRNQYNLDNPNDKIKFLKEISKLLSEIDNKIEQEIFIEKIANENQISKEAIYAEVNKLSYSKESVEKILKKPIVKKEKEVEVSPAIIKRENMIIYLLINDFEKMSEKIKYNITDDDFKLEVNKKIFNIIFNLESKENILNALSNIEDEEIQTQVSQIVVQDYEINSEEKCLDDIINNYIKERLNTKKVEIINAIDNSENLSKEEISKLEEELSKVIIQLAKMK